MDLLHFGGQSCLLQALLQIADKLLHCWYTLIFTEKILALSLITCHIKGEFSALVEETLMWYVCQ